MNYYNQHHDSISTVQLSPFGEDQWNRIVTYSPFYVHWTDMLMLTQKRPNKIPHGKLNVIDQIDLNTLKLEDEILLNELYHIRKAANLSAKNKNLNQESKMIFDDDNNNNNDQHITSSSNEDYQTSSISFQDSKDQVKHHCSYVEQPFTPQQSHHKPSLLTNQTNSSHTNNINQVKKLPQIHLGPKPQPSLGVQLRQSAIARDNVLSATHDRRIATPLSMSSSKRTISSAHSNNRQRTLQSALSSDLNPTEQLPRETSSLSMRRARARSTNSSRTTMHMLQTKNNRTRLKQNIELKTLLVEPWKQTYTDNILDEGIPNSLEIMNKMCGPATPFERNLRHNFHRQLTQFRNGSINS